MLLMLLRRYSHTPAYTLAVEQRDGTVLHAARRERPFLLMAGDGPTPTHLFTGMQLANQPRGGRQDHTFTHVQPINTA